MVTIDPEVDEIFFDFLGAATLLQAVYNVVENPQDKDNDHVLLTKQIGFGPVNLCDVLQPSDIDEHFIGTLNSLNDVAGAQTTHCQYYKKGQEMKTAWKLEWKDLVNTKTDCHPH